MSSGARFLVIHKDPANEHRLLKHLDEGGVPGEFRVPAAGARTQDRLYGPISRKLAAKMIREYTGRGTQFRYEDRWVAVFDLERPG